MARSRDISKVLSSNTVLATDAELGLSLITPTSVATNGGSATISSTGTVSFTSASAISLNNCFNASYNNYLVLYVASFGTVANTTVRLRNAGSDLSSALYRYAHHYIATNADHTLDTGNTQTSGRVFSSNFNRHSVQITFFNPFLTAKTQFDVQAGGGRDATVFSGSQYGSNEYDATTSVDGFSLIFSQTGDGTVRVYGYRN